MLNSISELIEKHLSPYHYAGNNEVRAQICPICHGGDNGDQYTFSINLDTGAYHCFRGNCNSSGGVVKLARMFGEEIRGLTQNMNVKIKTAYDYPKTKIKDRTQEINDYFESRGIGTDTLDAFKIGADEKGNIVFPFYVSEELTFVKFRKPHKAEKNEPKEWAVPNTRPVLFGMDLCKTDLPLCITEGQIDAMSLYEAGLRNVVSVPSGCENMKWIEECWDWLERFDNIIVFGDNDVPGKQMVNRLVKRLGESRCMIVEDYPLRPDGKECKDANEILVELGDMILLDVISSAKEIPVRGLINLASVIPVDPTTIPRIKTNIPSLDDAIGGLREGAVSVLTGKPGDGKLLADDTPVITKDGWKNHGDLQVGDYVLSDKGTWVKVLHVFPKSVANMKVTFSNHEVIYCHENHEWVCEKHSGSIYKARILETKTIKDDLSAGRNVRLPDRIPMFGAMKELAVEPYTLGVWLGDGRTSNPDICCDPKDKDVIRGIIEEGYSIAWNTVHKTTGVLYYGFHYLRQGLQRYGMCVSHHNYPKYIPDDYIVAPLDVRLKLLAGLLDTDGYLDKNRRRYTFSTTSVSLKDSFVALISSFGWRTDIYCAQPKLSSSGVQGKKPVYSIHFMPDINIPCRIERKRLKNFSHSNHIHFKSIEPCEPRSGNCIMVEGGVYCIGNTMLPTHNSTLGGLFLLNAIEQGYNVCAYSGELTSDEFQQWINMQAAGSDYITLKYDPVKRKKVPVVPQNVADAIMKWYDGKFFLFDNQEIFESNQSEAIIDVFTMAARKHDCRLFLVDNLMTSLSDADEETKAQGKFMNALKRFANRFKVHVIVVSHPRKTKYGETIKQDDIGGNSATVRLAHSAIVVEKPNLRVIKSRDSGSLRLIECCYCPDSHRIYQADVGDLNHFSWDDGTVTPPTLLASSDMEYAVQIGQPEGMF